MKSNIFQELTDKKNAMVALANKAWEFKWIGEEDKNHIVEKTDKDILTIAVIGQMKAGKSTFLNSFIFAEDILPSATTPMTAALSIITYGKEKKVVAEFYTKDEWAEQKLTASRSLDSVEEYSIEYNKIKASKELIERSKVLGNSLENYLGQTKEDSFDNLIEYVGADGKYVSITKIVTLYYPAEYLKGVEIVDTPGFNDPIVSREERTKDFLKKADVVLLLLFAGRPYDSTDNDILFNVVRECGTGKVLVGINKYDMVIEEFSKEELSKEVQKSIEKENANCTDIRLKEILNDVVPIPIIAELALLTRLPKSKIISTESYKYRWDAYAEQFGELSNNDLYRESNIEALSDAVKRMIETEKDAILFSKPLNTIQAAGEKKLEEVEHELRENSIQIKNLSSTDSELEERKENLDKVVRKVNKKYKKLEDSLSYEFDKICDNGADDLRNLFDTGLDKSIRDIDQLGKFAGKEKMDDIFKTSWNHLTQRIIPDQCKLIINQIKTKTIKIVKEFISDTEHIFSRHIEEFDLDESLDDIKSHIDKLVQNKQWFEKDEMLNKDSYDYTPENFFEAILFGYTEVCLTIGHIMGAGKAIDFYNSSDNKRETIKDIEKLKYNIDTTKYFVNIRDNKDIVVESIRKEIFDNLLSPLEKQLDDVLSHTAQKEKMLAEEKVKTEVLKERKHSIENEISEIQSLVNQLKK